MIGGGKKTRLLLILNVPFPAANRCDELPLVMVKWVTDVSRTFMNFHLETLALNIICIFILWLRSVAFKVEGPPGGARGIGRKIRKKWEGGSSDLINF